MSQSISTNIHAASTKIFIHITMPFSVQEKVWKRLGSLGIIHLLEFEVDYDDDDKTEKRYGEIMSCFQTLFTLDTPTTTIITNTCSTIINNNNINNNNNNNNNSAISIPTNNNTIATANITNTSTTIINNNVVQAILLTLTKLRNVKDQYFPICQYGLQLINIYLKNKIATYNNSNDDDDNNNNNNNNATTRATNSITATNSNSTITTIRTNKNTNSNIITQPATASVASVIIQEFLDQFVYDNRNDSIIIIPDWLLQHMWALGINKEDKS
jgi:hypothetical protein